jgi:hypothetical protein
VPPGGGLHAHPRPGHLARPMANCPGAQAVLSSSPSASAAAAHCGHPGPFGKSCLYRNWGFQDTLVFARAH